MEEEYNRRMKQEKNSFRMAISSVLILIFGIVTMIGLEPVHIKIIGFIIIVAGCMLYLIWVGVYATNPYT